MGDSIWGPEKTREADDEIRKIYVEVLRDGAVKKR